MKCGACGRRIPPDEPAERTLLPSNSGPGIVAYVHAGKCPPDRDTDQSVFPSTETPAPGG